MRKFIQITLAAATLATAAAPAIANAQGYGEVRQDRREMQRDRGEIRRDMARGDNREARPELRDDRREFREDRREYREDWRDYRQAHADRFRGPRYDGPRGYAYRPVSVGYRFAPEYYSQRYWVNNPAYYRLPALPRHERWVRYGRDVVRVDIGSGRTLQVFGSFFL
jgi:hypothetical protein